jgi:hypothetical protein
MGRAIYISRTSYLIIFVWKSRKLGKCRRSNQHNIECIFDQYYYTTYYTVDAFRSREINLGHGYPHEDRHAFKNGGLGDLAGV